MRAVINWARQGGPVLRFCTWGLLSMLIVGTISFAVCMLVDGRGYTLVSALLAVAGLMGLGVLGWIRPRPSPDAIVTDGEPTHTCAACKAQIRPGDVYATLNILVEQASASEVTVHAAEMLASYCRAACIRELWAHLEPAVPDWRAGDAQVLSETLTQLRG